MGSTPNWGIYYLENGDPQSQITESSVQAGTVEAALDQVGSNIGTVDAFGVRYYLNASARDLALPSPEVGWLTQLDSELFMRRWDGTAWRPYGSGMFPIKPGSVSGTGISINLNSGIVNLSNASGDLHIEGIFSSEFPVVLAQGRIKASSGAGQNINARLRTGGVTSTTGYTIQSGNFLGATVNSSGSTSTGTGIFTTLEGSVESAFETKFFDVSSGTTSSWMNTSGGASGIAAGRVSFSAHASLVAYESLTLSPNSPSSGWIRFYGMN